MYGYHFASIRVLFSTMDLLPNLFVDISKEWRTGKAELLYPVDLLIPFFSYAIRLWVLFIELRIVAMTIGCAFPLH